MLDPKNIEFFGFYYRFSGSIYSGFCGLHKAGICCLHWASHATAEAKRTSPSRERAVAPTAVEAVAAAWSCRLLSRALFFSFYFGECLRLGVSTIKKTLRLTSMTPESTLPFGIMIIIMKRPLRATAITSRSPLLPPSSWAL